MHRPLCPRAGPIPSEKLNASWAGLSAVFRRSLFAPQGLTTLFAMLVTMVGTRYQRWMQEWETRLTSVDNNRVVRPLEWGTEWATSWHCSNGHHPGGDMREHPEEFLIDYNRRILAHSDEFFSYRRPADFRLERREVRVFSTREMPDPKLEQKVQGKYANFLRFTSPVDTPYAENNLVNARWFPVRGRRAVIVLPHWNADAISYTALCRVLNWMGIAALRLSMPYHDIRRPAEIRRADYAVSANIGRTLDAVRQGVVDVRCCLDWLEQQGYCRLGIVGTSLGSCLAFLTSAHDGRIQTAVFNHASSYFADVVWYGQSTRHIRAALETELDLDRLRRLWAPISPMSYFPQFARYGRKSLIIYALYDLTFLPEFSRQVVEEFRRHGLDYRLVALPCGHYTTGEAPYKYLDGWQIVSFLRSAFES